MDRIVDEVLTQPQEDHHFTAEQELEIEEEQQREPQEKNMDIVGCINTLVDILDLASTHEAFDTGKVTMLYKLKNDLVRWQQNNATQSALDDWVV